MAKPVVDGLERDLQGKAALLRLNLSDAVSAELAARYGVRAVPTFVLLDGKGDPVLSRVGTPDREEVVGAVEQLLAE